MEANKILDHLFFINNELKLEDADQFFGQLGFHNTTREDSILSYMSNDSSDLNGISWYVLNLDGGRILNSNFRTTKEINLESVVQHVEKHHGFKFDEETGDSLIYKKDDAQMHVRTIKTPLTYTFYLFNSSRKPVDVIMMPTPFSKLTK